ncbi:MAG: hypothetical protein B7Y41_10435 [Hydrogenophilales bacterium 28-61-23]|nr:MAG: hypothetical protein B7Y41_10435 [Hydrogenophilales bacterium 28-61-23]
MSQALSEFSELAAMPPTLRALLEAELAAGNQVAEIDRGFPAPLVGCCVLLAKPVGTRASGTDDGLCFEEWPNWKGYNGYTDAQRRFFVLNPPYPPPPDPVMRWDERGAAICSSTQAEAPPEARQEARQEAQTNRGDSLLRRFKQSMEIDYGKWHDGIGYDLEALRVMAGDQRETAQVMLLAHGIGDWRDVEALALLDSPAARSALRVALESADAQIRLAVARHAPDLVPPEVRTASLVTALETVTAFDGLTQAMDEAASFHPPEVMDALWRGVRDREGDVAVHFAGLLTYLHGKADSVFDYAQRPFFLTFNTRDKQARAAAVALLRDRLIVSPDA